jgi:hypothetical protein
VKVGAAFRSAALASAAVLLSPEASAKDVGFRSPGGRAIYDSGERFGDVVDQNQRFLVVEVATGLAPEGNLAILLGVLNVPVSGLEMYLGYGVELNPAVHYSASVRYFPELGDFRPYLGLGYLYKDTYAIGVASHNLFAELGHKWVIHQTYHLTVGAGVRRLLALQIDRDSILNDPDVDRALLDEQIDEELPRWLPTLALRFSRAF